MPRAQDGLRCVNFSVSGKRYSGSRGLSVQPGPEDGSDTMSAISESAPGTRKFQSPSSSTSWCGFIIVVAAVTWASPARQYGRAFNPARDREVPVAGSYAETEPSPQGITDVIMAPIGGLYNPATNEANAIDVAV